MFKRLDSCKFLIFAHHQEVLNGIEEEILKQKVGYIRIDGSVMTEKRQKLVNKFQTDDSCLVAILSITACATGLTLTKASTVVFAEMHFTPAIMIQAEDRAHRIGQENNCVNVHYLYGSGTVDEIIFPKLREKFAVVTTTLDDQRMDMDVQKLKSGCVGDINQTNISSVDSVKLNIKKFSPAPKKKANSILDYFKKSDKKEEEKKQEDGNNPDIADEFEVPVEGMMTGDLGDCDNMSFNIHDTGTKRRRVDSEDDEDSTSFQDKK